jgi:hypothetical protein
MNPEQSADGAVLAPSTVRPFDATAQTLADLMQSRGFRVARGTYHHGNGDTLPTWVIDRPEDPSWNGVWQPWESQPEMPEDGESQTLLALCGTAIEKWNDVAWMYCDAPNVQDDPHPPENDHE